MTVLRRVAAGALGLAGGIVVWYISMFALVVLGFSFYAVNASLYLALAITLIGAPLVYRRARRRSPQMIQYLLPFLVGVVAFLVYGCLAPVWTSS